MGKCKTEIVEQREEGCSQTSNSILITKKNFKSKRRSCRHQSKTVGLDLDNLVCITERSDDSLNTKAELLKQREEIPPIEDSTPTSGRMHENNDDSTTGMGNTVHAERQECDQDDDIIEVCSEVIDVEVWCLRWTHMKGEPKGSNQESVDPGIIAEIQMKKETIVTKHDVISVAAKIHVQTQTDKDTLVTNREVNNAAPGIDVQTQTEETANIDVQEINNGDAGTQAPTVTEASMNISNQKVLQSATEPYPDDVDPAFVALLANCTAAIQEGVAFSDIHDEMKERIRLQFETVLNRINNTDDPSSGPAVDDMAYLLTVYPHELVPQSILDYYLS